MDKDKTKNMKKSIIMMVCVCLTLMVSTYAWFLHATSSDVSDLRFLTSDSVEVKFYGYNEETGNYDHEMAAGELQLAGLKPGNSVTVRMKIERTDNVPKQIYIKMLGVEILGANESEPYVVTKGGVGYTLGNFLAVNIKTVETTPQSITVNSENGEGGNIFFTETTDTLAKVLEIVQGYTWTAAEGVDQPLYLDMTVSLLDTIQTAGGEALSVNSFQKQTVRTKALNVQGVDL